MFSRSSRTPSCAPICLVSHIHHLLGSWMLLAVLRLVRFQPRCQQRAPRCVALLWPWRFPAALSLLQEPSACRAMLSATWRRSPLGSRAREDGYVILTLMFWRRKGCIVYTEDFFFHLFYLNLYLIRLVSFRVITWPWGTIKTKDCMK